MRMTKQILIFAYILTVLIISSLVRADGLGIVRDVVVNQTSGIMEIHGVLPTPCHSGPAIVVKNINRTQGAVTFDVTTINQRQVCVDVISKEFDITFDLKDLPLDAGKTYSIIFENFKGPGPFE